MSWRAKIQKQNALPPTQCVLDGNTLLGHITSVPLFRPPLSITIERVADMAAKLCPDGKWALRPDAAKMFAWCQRERTSSNKRTLVTSAYFVSMAVEFTFPLCTRIIYSIMLAAMETARANPRR